MKSLYVTLIAIVALAVFASVATAQAPALHSWSSKFTRGRFLVLTAFGSAAVLDYETGLVWEKSPLTSSHSWGDAQTLCNNSNPGGNRLGWRLPTLQELASLVDNSQSNPALPAGHPFTGVQSDAYWSATTSASFTSEAWVVTFHNNGAVLNDGEKTEDFFHVWCVRTGQGVDPQ